MMHPTDEFFNFDKCNSCDFVFINPRVHQNELYSYYTSYYQPYQGSEAWGKFKSIVERSQRKLDSKKLSIVEKYNALTKNTTILDIGCGKPTFLKTCVENSNCKALGIDFSDFGWKTTMDDYFNIDLLVGEVKDLNQTIKPDVITMWHYLEHDYTPKQNLRHLKAISKPTTSLIIEVPNFDSHSRRKFNQHWAGWHTPRHTSLFSPKNITLLLEQTGWKIKDILPYGTLDAYLLYWMSKMEQKQIEWNKSLENEFLNFILGLIKFYPLKLKEKQKSLGIMTVIATPMV